MSLKFGWSRRTFLSALGAAGGSLLAPAELKAAGKWSDAGEQASGMAASAAATPSGAASGAVK